MNRTFKNILIAVTLTLSAVSGFAQTQEELSVKTLREIPSEAKELLDTGSIDPFSGNWTNVTERKSSNLFKYKPLEKKVELWIRAKNSACSMRNYNVTQVFETSTTTYMKTVLQKPSSPVCNTESWVAVFEVSKSKKEGFFSTSVSEGLLVID